jgi:calcium-dependent protein kinase
MQRIQDELEQYRKVVSELVWVVIRESKYKGIPAINHMEEDSHHFPYELGMKLGQGAFGVVLKAKKKSTGDEVAIKRLKKDKVFNMAEVERIENEIVYLGGLSHPNVVQLLDVIHTPQYINIITRFASGGTLKHYIDDPLSEEQGRYIMRQLLEGVNYLHTHDVAHRDIKPENILINAETCTVLIADFGFATKWSKDRELISGERIGTLAYIAPEILRKQKYNPFLCDMWGVGCVFIDMILGRRGSFSDLYKFSDSQASQVEFVKRVLESEELSLRSLEERDFLASLLRVNSADRFTAARALKSDYFVNVNSKSAALPFRSMVTSSLPPPSHRVR